MTCIVGIARGSEVYIGADSAGANSAFQLTLHRDKKVFRNGKFLIGGTTSFRMLQLLHYKLEVSNPEFLDKNCVLVGDWVERYMCTAFVDAIRQCFKDGGFATKYSEQEQGGRFLVGYLGRLFRIEEDYQVHESLTGYDAVGCGADVALGVLYATRKRRPQHRIETALKAAQEHSAGVRAPFYYEVL